MLRVHSTAYMHTHSTHTHTHQVEVEEDYLQSQADQYGYVLIACDWWGLAKEDLPAIVVEFVNTLSNSRIIPDRLTQGATNQLLLMRLMKVSCEPKNGNFDIVNLRSCKNNFGTD